MRKLIDFTIAALLAVAGATVSAGATESGIGFQAAQNKAVSPSDLKEQRKLKGRTGAKLPAVQAEAGTATPGRLKEREKLKEQRSPGQKPRPGSRMKLKELKEQQGGRLPAVQDEAGAVTPSDLKEQPKPRLPAVQKPGRGT